MKIASQPSVNNDIYHALGDRWYKAQDDPVALLRAESRLRNPWVAKELHARFAGRALRILDIGCGGGFLSNYLAAQGHTVIGIDLAADALKVAHLHDASGRVEYVEGDAYRLPFPNGSFDAVCSMDFLEHVEEPELAIREAARLVAPDGLFIFHTFSRNWVAWLVVIKGVEWFVRNTPPQHARSASVHQTRRPGFYVRPLRSFSGLPARHSAGGLFQSILETVFSTNRARQLYLPLHTVHQDFLLRIRPQDPRP